MGDRKDKAGKGRGKRSGDGIRRRKAGSGTQRERPKGDQRPARRRDSAAGDGRSQYKRIKHSEPAGRPPQVESPENSEDRILLAAARSGVGPAGYRRFSDIPAHKLGRNLRVKLYLLAKGLPEDERDNLANRMKSAATTVTAALVTGFGEGTFRSGIRRALESRGALFALQDHLDQMAQLEMIPTGQRDELRVEVDEVIASVNDYLGELVRARDRSAGGG